MATVLGGTPPFVPTGGSGGMLSSLAGAMGGMFNPTVNIRSQAPDAIQRKRDTNDWAVQQALQPGRGQGAGVGLSKLAVALMARHKNKGLDASEAQNKADAETKEQAAAAQQGALVKALFEAQQGGNLPDALKTMDFSNPAVQQAASQIMGRKPDKPIDKYKTEQDTFGRGGAWQVNERTGKYEKLLDPEKKTEAKVYDAVTVKMRDGTTATYRKNDPRLDAAFDKGGVPFKSSVEGSQSEVFDPTKKTTDELQKGLLSSNENLARLEQAADMFDPDYLTYQTGIEQAALKVAEKAGVDIGESGREKITKVSKFKRNAIENLNLYIKEITGAQMSEAEADRLRKAVPDAENDSPTEFKAKMDDAIEQLRKKQTRYAYALENGIEPESLYGQETGPWEQAAAAPEASAGTGYEQMSDDEFAKSYL